MGERIIGEHKKVSFAIEWEPAQKANTAAEATRGALTAKIGGHPVWGEADRGFTWTWIELLEHLSESWRFIVWEEGDPLGLGDPPPDLRSAARRRWDALPGVLRDSEEEDLWAFENAHNLSAAVQGAWLPDLWIVREGTNFVVASNGKIVREPASSTLETLRELGDTIRERVDTVRDARSTRAREAWARKDRLGADDFVSVVTGYDAGTLNGIVGARDSTDFWELGEQLQTTEVLAAARMLGPALSPSETRAVLSRIRRVGCRDTMKVDEFARHAQAACSGSVAYEQGQSVALSLRQELKLGPDDTIDPAALLKQWNVLVSDVDLTSGLDAISCWGPRHGPAVLVNVRGRHAQDTWGRRATLAHEVCHLLLDRGSALPVAEVLGGRVPRDVEARARAFAAELLLPRDIAGQLLSQKVDDPQRAVNGIRRRFGVSREIVCWQAINSRVKLPKETWTHVRSVVQESTGTSWLGLAV